MRKGAQVIGDARGALRRAVEGAIALNALANDAAFLDQLINAHYHYQRKQARLLLNNPDYRPTFSQAEIDAMEATVRDIDAKAAAGAKIADINWADVAGVYCKDLYSTLYRLLSNDGTHTNINAIHREIIYGVAGQITGVKVGPDTSDMIETLKAACLMFLWAADPFARTFNQNDTRTRIQEALQRFEQLPGGEPRNVTVVSNF
ncbi:MAG: hypothetical protein KGL11_03900 [Alphaproteobacteria bacterium]|nr:hypothetical protein [Alphaproteobacteria bacterium]